jgi:8-oxoguanine deaminase
MVKGSWRVVDALPVGVDLARLRREHGEAAKAFLETF